MIHTDASRDAADTQLARFVLHAGADYARHRNTDNGPSNRQHVSTLSPWLRHRCLLEDDVLAAVLAEHTPASASAFVQEVFWRGYFRGHLEHRPSLWTRYCTERDAAWAHAQSDTSLQRRLDTARRGETGIACFDHWAHELIANGYLHNHARMWFASIWIFTLELPWTLGADFFLTHLLDGDPASNTCSWRWVAGLHTKGKVYAARSDNIATFTNGRFPHTPGLASDASPLEESPLPPVVAPAIEADATLASPCRLGVLIVESDCQAESLTLPSTPCSVLTLTNPCQRAVEALSEPAAEFTRLALIDASERAAKAFGVHANTDANSHWETAIRAWIATEQLDVVAVARPPVGWVHDRLQPVLAAIEDTGICVTRITRPHDRVVWPHSAKGFFKLKKQIPSILANLNLPTS